MFEARAPEWKAALEARAQKTTEETQGRCQMIPNNMQNPLTLLPKGGENQSPVTFRRSPSPSESLIQPTTANVILTPDASLEFFRTRALSPPLQVRFQEGTKSPTREERQVMRTRSLSSKNAGKEVRITLLSAKVRAL